VVVQEPVWLEPTKKPYPLLEFCKTTPVTVESNGPTPVGRNLRENRPVALVITPVTEFVSPLTLLRPFAVFKAITHDKLDFVPRLQSVTLTVAKLSGKVNARIPGAGIL
jgi:hypothetical protein